jgi:Domain of unknown function (DUF6852)/Domain of unknown function (DUF5606)
MNLEEYVAVSGMSGLFRLVTNRSNGLVVADLDSGKSKFASSRKHQFTPLASIGIYTETDTAELSDVFATMLKQLESNPPVPAKSPAEEIVEYFDKILPEFDRDRVNVSDIRKVIKWFNFLNERDLLSLDEEKEKEEEATKEEVVEEEKAKAETKEEEKTEES